MLLGTELQETFTQLIIPHAQHWKEIGILLDIDFNQLEELEQTYHNDLTKCCKQMIQRWMQTDKNPSHKKLVISIKLATTTQPLQINPHLNRFFNGERLYVYVNVMLPLSMVHA